MEIGDAGPGAGPLPSPASPLGGQRPAKRWSVQALIVDLDGTMVDTLGDFDVALNETLKALGRPGVTRADIERMVGEAEKYKAEDERGIAYTYKQVIEHPAVWGGAFTRFSGRSCPLLPGSPAHDPDCSRARPVLRPAPSPP